MEGGFGAASSEGGFGTPPCLGSTPACAMHVQCSWQSGGCAIGMGVATKTLPTKLLIILNSNTQEKSVDNVSNISNEYIYSKKGIFVIKCVLNILQF